MESLRRWGAKCAPYLVFKLRRDVDTQSHDRRLGSPLTHVESPVASHSSPSLSSIIPLLASQHPLAQLCRYSTNHFPQIDYIPFPFLPSFLPSIVPYQWFAASLPMRWAGPLSRSSPSSMSHLNGSLQAVPSSNSQKYVDWRRCTPAADLSPVCLAMRRNGMPTVELSLSFFY